MQDNNTKKEGYKKALLGGEHFHKAIKDPEFYKKLPQFLTIKAKLDAMHVNLTKPSCSSCQKRRIQRALEGDFAVIAATLSPEAGKVFKEYFGVDAMLVNVVDPVTKAVRLKHI